MRHHLPVNLFFIVFFCLAVSDIAAQTPVNPNRKSQTRLVEIIPGARKLEYRRIDSITELQILVGNVRLKQGNTFSVAIVV